MYIVLILVLIILLLLNIYEGLGVFAYGWIGRSFSIVEYVRDEHNIPVKRLITSAKSVILCIITLPGAILGFIIGIVFFQWIHW